MKDLIMCRNFQPNSSVSIRQSNMELLRIVAMLSIIIYHLFFHNFSRLSSDPFFIGIQMPLHYGVLLFILISGYFGIKASPKGLFRLVVTLFCFHVISIGITFFTGQSLSSYSSLFFISLTPYWFFREYILLYLLSPMIEIFISNRQRLLYLLGVTCFFSAYMGGIWQFDYLSHGHNCVHFIFLYTLGRFFVDKMVWIKKISLKLLIIMVLLFNTVPFTLYYYFPSLRQHLFLLNYSYASPLIILNAILLFSLFIRIDIGQIKWLNSLATTVFVTYLVHESAPIRDIVATRFAIWVMNNTISHIYVFLLCFLYAVLMMSFCWGIGVLFNCFLAKLIAFLHFEKKDSKFIYRIQAHCDK